MMWIIKGLLCKLGFHSWKPASADVDCFEERCEICGRWYND